MKVRVWEVAAQTKTSTQKAQTQAEAPVLSASWSNVCKYYYIIMKYKKYF